VDRTLCTAQCPDLLHFAQQTSTLHGCICQMCCALATVQQHAALLLLALTVCHVHNSMGFAAAGTDLCVCQVVGKFAEAWRCTHSHRLQSESLSPHGAAAS
jgi:hypothetical protein